MATWRASCPAWSATSAPNIGRLGLGSSGAFNAYGDSGLQVLIDGFEIRSNTYPDWSSARGSRHQELRQQRRHRRVRFGVESGEQVGRQPVPRPPRGAVHQRQLPGEQPRRRAAVAGPELHRQRHPLQRLQLPTSAAKSSRTSCGSTATSATAATSARWPAWPRSPDPTRSTAPATRSPYLPVVWTMNWTGKLSYQPTPKHQLVGFVARDYSVNDGGAQSSRAAQRFIPVRVGDLSSAIPCSTGAANTAGRFATTCCSTCRSGRMGYTVIYNATPADHSNREITARWDRETGIYHRRQHRTRRQLRRGDPSATTPGPRRAT